MAGLKSRIVEFDIKKARINKLNVKADGDFLTKDNIYWIHVNLNKKKIFKLLQEKLSLPDYMENLCFEDETFPKIIETSSALTIRVQAPVINTLSKKSELEFENIIIHLTNEYCFTASSRKLSSLVTFDESYEKALPFAKTPCFILFLIFDNIIHDFSQLLLEYEDIADDIDLKIRNSDTRIYNEIMDNKKSLMRLKRLAIVIRDTLMRISSRKITVVSEQCRLSLSNLFNHTQVIISEADVILDIINNSLDRIDNILMQKVSESMRILTAFASICLPLSLIVGIYGMNFKYMPELTWKYGYIWALSLMGVFGIGLYIFFKIKKWF